MLTKQKCCFDDKKEAVKWIEVPVEKEDIIAYLKKRISYIEADFKYCSSSDFFSDIDFLRVAVLVFSDLDILTAFEVREYLHIQSEFYERYKELKKYVSVS